MGFIIGVRLSTFGGVITDLWKDRFFFCEFLVVSFFLDVFVIAFIFVFLCVYVFVFEFLLIL